MRPGIRVRSVVEADHIFQGSCRGAGGTGGKGLTDHARRVLRLDRRDERLCDGGVVVIGDLVSDAPNDDARMVAVAHDHVADIGRGPLVEESSVVVRVLALVPTIKRLIHHEETHAIGHIQEFWCRRVVRRAKPVDTHVLELL